MRDTLPTPNIPLIFDRSHRTYHLPDALKVSDMIVAAAQHQIANAATALAIIAAGLEHELRNLIQQVAANAANPIVCAFEDALDLQA